MLQVRRPTIIVGNWKMHKTISEAKTFIEKLALGVNKSNSAIWIAVPFTAIQASADIAINTPIIIGAQNAHEQESGAFTGEISCHMLKEAGAFFVILGHSERRMLFHETNLCINKKIKQALKNELRPLVCIGETLEQHQKHLTGQVLEQQLSQCFENLTDAEMENIVLAYEPIWAIGTNQTATPAQAQSIHKFCREYLKRHWNNAVAEKIVILYGGSVKPDNASALLAESDIDGLLIGGSSLSVDSFSKIIEGYNINVS
ncbi:MAG: triose-phosphate isomerase [Parachlamydiaceae bacterium]|nr:triose-phosphate isomerase [Parachlamydiaceae bacterium]